MNREEPVAEAKATGQFEENDRLEAVVLVLRSRITCPPFLFPVLHGRVVRSVYFLFGLISFALGAVGAFLPLLPTVPLLILAAFCFARSSPALERRIVEHPMMKPHIAAWRERRAISRKGKVGALVAFAFSAAAGLLLLPFPLMFVPTIVGAIGSAWIATRPTG
jgi:hypothetical protein